MMINITEIIVDDAKRKLSKQEQNDFFQDTTDKNDDRKNTD